MKKRLLFVLAIAGIVLLNACEPEKSFENGTGPSAGTLQDDGAGDCLPKTVAGAYVTGIALNGTANYIEVQVDVTTIGSYTIYTDTVNGIYFRATGNFTAAGLNMVTLQGNGTPVAAGIHNFIVSYGTSSCAVAVTTSGTLAVFTLDGAPGGCTSAAPVGTYTAGTALTAANTVTLSVNVTTAGAYNITTVVSNGMTFTGSGTFTTTGSQTIILTGSGTPATAGTTNIPVTAGSSSCSFPVTVGAAAGAATFTMNCATAAVNGTYMVGAALVGTTNTISISVDVATAGTYTITGTINGMTFSASGTFAATGTQTVTLAGSGTPTTAGSNSLTITGGTANCSSVTITVNPAAGGAATYTTSCTTATVNGTYTVGTALTVTNTITLPVNVTTAGTYTITATLNGMTFSASGTFATTGAQNVTLNGTGTPTTAGANAIPVTGGTAGCNVTVTVNPGAGGAATFTVDCSSAALNGYLTKGVPVAAVNTISIDVNVTVAGTYTITTTPTNGIIYSASGTFATTGLQTVTLNGSGTPVNSGDFTIPVASGTTPCSFVITVDPNYGTWTFRVGTTTYSGTFYDAAFDNTVLPAPAILFVGFGDNAPGDLFAIGLGDANGTIVTGETYNCAPPVAGNIGLFAFENVAGTITYDADPVTAAFATNTLVISGITHNTATKTITGVFSGKAILNGTTTLVDITNGQFTVTYP
ncbi:MAG: hypothetical protein JNK14_09060 [Chitinophagaceae bacterium]|nr:hypothetical protein [Chitinophagaceae bacterium]